MMGYRCDCGCNLSLMLKPVLTPSYYRLDDAIRLIVEPYRSQIDSLYATLRNEFPLAPGSGAAHQFWPEGYFHHVTEVCNFSILMHQTFDPLRHLPFSLSDVLVVDTLHDIEKPWKHSGKFGKQPKEWWLDFKFGVIEAAGINLTPQMFNAIRYCEGEGQDYTPGERVMNELAAFCHCADILSARLCYEFGKTGKW